MLGRILGGRYNITRHLGGGGFGQTYLAEDQHLPGKPWCVVKQLKPRMKDADSLQAARRLFNTEAEVLYSLGDHDQIPRLFAHFEENQEFYLVQEYIEGETLSRELRAKRQFGETEVIDLLLDILHVLEFVHQQQVVHRDIKPSNLIRRKSDEKIILIDFGAVKQIEIPQGEPSHQMSVTIAVGSSGYMPNEQLAGKPRYSSDIYAVGMVGIQALTGIYPRKLREDPKTSEVIWREHCQVSPELGDVLDLMVRYDFRQRYQSATEALRALHALYSAPTAPMIAEPLPLQIQGDGYLAWLERGDELFQLQRYREAVASYDRVIHARPEEYLAWFKRGIALENLQHYEEAIVSYDRVVQLQPEDYLAWFKRGAALEALQRYGEAVSSYGRVLELKPDNYWAWHDRGRVLERLQKYEEAVAAYDRAVQLKPDFQMAVESRKRLLSQLKRVDSLYHLQHYDEVLSSCDRAIQANPKDSLAWLMRGMAMENLQQYEEAVRAYEQVVESQPDDHLAWFKRASALQHLERYEEAANSYLKVVHLQPDNYWAWHDRGKVLEILQRYEEALVAYDRAVQVKHDFQAAVVSRRRMLSQLQRGVSGSETDFPSMVGDDETVISRATALPPPNIIPSGSSDHSLAEVSLESSGHFSLLEEEKDEENTVVTGGRAAPEAEITTMVTPGKASDQESEYRRWFQKGRALEKLLHYTEALAAYDRAIQLKPESPDILRWRSNVLYTLGRYEAAIASYEEYLKQRPDSPEIWCCLAGAMVKLKRYKEAVGCFDRAIQLQPSSHSAWYWRGRVLYELKRYPEAIRSYDRALTLKPDFSPAIADREKARSRAELQGVITTGYQGSGN